MKRLRILCCLLAGLLLTADTTSGTSADRALPRLEKHTSEDFDQILRENALFFDILVTFSFTVAIGGPAWGLRAKNINLNLITRALRDFQGRQIVRARVAGVVRKNNNVELDILNNAGVLVGKGFFGYESGQLSFYDRNDKPIISGFIDSRGDFVLDDLRLPSGKRGLANGYVDACFRCFALQYGWWDGLNFQVGGGRIFPAVFSGEDSTERVRIDWTFERGRLQDNHSASGEAEYDLTSEVTGAINSNLFDLDRTTESFFANPYSLVPEPVGKSLIPRFSDETGIAVTNPSSREASITYIARHSDGSLVAGDGIDNPVTYRFAAGQQYAAFPCEIFRGQNEQDCRRILNDNELGWIEVFSHDTDVQAMYLEADSSLTALDGNLGAERGSAPLIFADLRLGPGETTDIVLLNLAYDDIMVRLEILDRDGRILREEREFFIAGYGIRHFELGENSNFLRGNGFSPPASLRVSCNNDNSLKSSSCSKLIGVATYYDEFQSVASGYAASSETSGLVLLGAHFVTGRAGEGAWETVVNITKLDGVQAMVHMDLYDVQGNLLETLKQSLPIHGQASFRLNASELSFGNRFTTGYVRLRSDSGKIAGDVSVGRQARDGSLSTTYSLTASLSDRFHFNQVAQGASGGIEYYTGIALVNDSDKQVLVTVKIFRADGGLDRTASLSLQPYQQNSRLLSQILNDSSYSRLTGYMEVTASEPISALVLYGDVTQKFLSAVPGLPR